MSECLRRLLSPLDTRVFLEHYRARRYFHISRNSPVYFDDLLTAGGMNNVLQSQEIPSAFIKVVKEGNTWPAEEWSRIDASRTRSGATEAHRVAVPARLFELYSQGATVILNEAGRTIPTLKELCRTLTLDLGFPANANIYMTPGGAMGFAKHADDHEVIVIQIAGTKLWQLYPQDAPVLEIELRTGDLLYLPKDLPHAASACEDGSTHITIGLWPVYAFQLIQELLELAAGSGGFEQPMPLLLEPDDEKLAFDRKFLHDLEGLIRSTTPAELAGRRAWCFPRPQARGPHIDPYGPDVLGRITTDTIVCRRSGIVVVIKEDGKLLNVGFAGTHVIVPAFLRGALDPIMGSQAFAIGDIQGFLVDSGKVKLVTEFISGGLLRIVSL